jgi:hypothetical protein
MGSDPVETKNLYALRPDVTARLLKQDRVRAALLVSLRRMMSKTSSCERSGYRAFFRRLKIE